MTAATIYMTLLGPQGLAQVAQESHARTRALVELASAVPGVRAAFTGPRFHEAVLQLDAPLAAALERMAASGVLANRFGGRKVLGAAVLWWSSFTMLTPPAAMVSLPVLMASRIALGMGEAAVFPASVNMLARWVPAQHRSRASAFFISTLSLGAMISLPVTGWLVRDFGWPLPFYAFGALGLVWAVAWFALTREGRSEAESSNEPRAIPWRRLIRSSGVWALTINHFCSNWVLYVLLSWLPSYFKTTFNVSLTNAGLMAAAPWAAVLAEPLACGLRWSWLMLNASGAGLGLHCHGTPAALLG